MRTGENLAGSGRARAAFVRAVVFVPMAAALAASPACAHPADAALPPLLISADPAAIPALPAEYGEALDRAFDGMVATALLSMPLSAHEPARTVSRGLDAWHRPAPAIVPLLPRASGRIGDDDGVAVGLDSRMATATALVTDLSLGHRSGPVDVHVDVTGTQPLARQPMQLAYQGWAMVDVVQGLRVGMTAKGSLGTLLDPAAAPDQTAQAVARWKLLGKASSLTAETGVDLMRHPFGQGAGMPGLPPAFHMNISLNFKL